MNLLLAFAVLAITANFVYAGPRDYEDEFKWRAYKKKFGKNYAAAEDAKRKINFKKADNIIKRNNAKPNPSFTLAHNEHSDWSDEEFNQLLGITEVPKERGNFNAFTAGEDRQLPPASLDYRNDNCMPPVKSQGLCGSCWAFAAITPLEFARCKQTKNSVVLSEQQLVDCDRNGTNKGCLGGFYSTAWQYHQLVGGAATESRYTYNALGDNTCKFKSSMVDAKVSNYAAVQAKNATAMQIALQKYGPISLAMTVISSLHYYSSGVYDDLACNDKNVNHGVVAVGWGVQNETTYWIIRNSWGPEWGQQGYVLIKSGENLCKIEEWPFVAETN